MPSPDRNIADRTFSITTLGCKLNQYESESIRQCLADSGWEYRPFEDGASVMIINTCTVTGKTDSRCRNAARRARRIAPEALVVVTGCYAEIDPAALEKMPEIDIVMGNSEKGKIPGLLEELVDRDGGNLHLSTRDALAYGIDEFLGHSRAFIKVQEGCDSNCAYCIIPRARGTSRSIDKASILEQVGRLEENGCEEVVLTGIHVGRYGFDLDGGGRLSDLVSEILAVTDKVRIRLSSIELNEVTDELVSLIGPGARLAPHLHIPLQSGDDEILEKMRRPYVTSVFRDRIMDIKARLPHIGLGTDIIVGFPGEDDRSFERTRSFLRNAPIDYFHVFSYSIRPGTPASLMKDQVAPQKKKSRSAALISIGKEKRKRFMISQAGKRCLLLMQGKRSKYSRYRTGMTGNYCEVDVECDGEYEGRLKEARIIRYDRGRLYGELV